jgi:phosphoglycerol transferase
VLFFAFLLELTPNLIYFYEHPSGLQVSQRHLAHTEMFSLKISQLILPVTGHRLSFLASLKSKYNIETQPNENDMSSLGIIGASGFLYLICAIFIPLRNEVVRALSMLSVAGVLFTSTGGFSSIFALLVSARLRSHNRVSVYLGFMALLAVAVFLTAMHRRLQSRYGVSKSVWLFSALMAIVLVIGVLDQTTGDFVPHYHQLRATWTSEQSFVKQIEERVGPGGMVFQLPYVPFPENQTVFLDPPMREYDLLKGYLHSENTRWSYASMKLVDDWWQKKVASEPTAELVNALAIAGFGGIYIDRYGYSDRGKNLEAALTENIGEQPMVISNERLSFFDLRLARERIQNSYTERELQKKRDLLLYPAFLQWGKGFAKIGEPEKPWGVWSARVGELAIINRSASSQKINMDFIVSTGYPDYSTIRIKTPNSSRDLLANETGSAASIQAIIPPGRYAIEFAANAKPAPSSLRRRVAEMFGLTQERVFRIGNLRMSEVQ